MDLRTRCQVLWDAKRSVALLYAAIAVLVVAVVGQAWPAVSRWIGVPESGPVTLLGIPILAWGIGAFGLLFGIWMWEHAYRLTRRLEPELAWFYDDREPDCNKKVSISADEGQTAHSGRSIRLKIFCRGSVNVEQCSGFLTRIQYRALGGLFSDIPFYEPGYLRWALEEPQPYTPVTVFPRVPRYLGVCSTSEKESGFRIRTRARSFVTPEIFTDKGEYKIHLEIVGAKSPPLSLCLLVTWNGNWNEIRAKADGARRLMLKMTSASSPTRLTPPSSCQRARNEALPE